MSYFFRLPALDDLTADQQLALNETKPIALSGGAGTGKSVVLLWRHMGNIERGKKSILMTYTKSLQAYLHFSAKSSGDIEASLRAHTVLGWIKRRYKYPYKAIEIIIDEAQDLTFDDLKTISEHCSEVSYGADRNQQLYENRVSLSDENNELKKLFPSNIEYDLQQNFRNTYFILNFAKFVLKDLFINQSTLEELKESNLGIKPKIFEIDGLQKEIEHMVSVINEHYSQTHNIAILLPFGESNYYTTEQSVEKYFHLLTEKGLDCSCYYSKAEDFQSVIIKNIHITTFKSAKGLEFDTVIIPQFDRMENNIANKNSYIEKEDYYVAFTRARRNLFLYGKNITMPTNGDIYENVTV